VTAARWVLAVVFAWLMPWRAARTIRELREDMSVLLRFTADVVTTRPPATGAPPRLYRVK
jgi:hypothetical protein